MGAIQTGSSKVLTEGNLQPGVPGSVPIELDSQSKTYSTLQDYVNLFTSPGLVAGGGFLNLGVYNAAQART